MNVNLILALFWLILSIGVFLYPLLNPAGGRLNIGDTGFSFAWVAVFLFGFNMIRWWSIRLQRRVSEERRRETDRPREKEYNPEFDFRDEE